MTHNTTMPRVALAAAFLGVTAAAAMGFMALAPSMSGKAAAGRDVQLVELIGMKYPLGRTTDVLDTPRDGAPALTRVRQGSEVTVVGVVEGDGWYQIALPDQRIAYVRLDAIPAAAPPAAPPPALPARMDSAAAPAPAAPVQTAPTPEAEAGAPTVDVPPVITFEEAHDLRRVVSPSAVYLKPSHLSPQAYPVDRGTQVYVIARSQDGEWAWVETADNAPAYMPVADIGK